MSPVASDDASFQEQEKMNLKPEGVMRNHSRVSRCSGDGVSLLNACIHICIHGTVWVWIDVVSDEVDVDGVGGLRPCTC